MTMTRVKRALLSLTVAIALSACTSGPAAPPQSEATASGRASTGPADDAPADDTPETVAALRTWTGDLDGMIERRVIRVLTTYSKTTFFIDRGTQLGLVPDAFRLFEDDLNAKLKTKNLRIHVLFVPVAHDDLIPALLDGRGDIVSAGKLATAWRGEQVDFTNPTRSDISSVIVTGPGIPPVPTVDDIGGREVYLRASDVSTKGVEQFNANLKARGKPPVKINPAPEVLADEDILEMVNAGLVPMTMADDYVAEFWKQIFPEITINAAAARTGGQTAMMVRKNSPQLMAALNDFIARYPEGSGTRNMLFQKYLQNVKYARQATSGADLARFKEAVGYLRRYSDQYQLDYLLMAAQGYQESGLDQRKKSPVGAVGVMQVMPATGNDMNVGNIAEIESNIHAGVKYMRFMIDRYYANEPMEPVDKVLFTFASYNAGPARIRQLRQRAEQRGLNPNKWFNNVEVIASERIGRETVQYVSNIYKYYLAYQMVIAQEEQRQKAKRAS
jgi:membrane-bound lytic murein transglycosylase MltF